MEPIKIYDGQDLLSFTYEDLVRYHGTRMIGGVALAYQMMRWGFPQICSGVPVRGGFRFYSGLGKNGQGIMDSLELVTRVRSLEKLELDMDYGMAHTGPLAPGGGRYYFELAYNGNCLAFALREGILPQEFLERSRQAHDYRAKGLTLPQTENERLLELRRQLARAILSLTGDALFVRV